jgi:hypothetical protein
MRVEEDDLVVRAANFEGLAIVAEAEKVFSKAAFFFFSAASLHDGVWAESLPGKAGENFARWNVFVCGGPAAVGLLGKYRWRNLAEAFGFDGSGAAGEVHRAVAACPGESCDCHNMGPFLDGGVEGCGEPSECQEEGEAADKCGGAVGEGESRAEGEAEDGGGGECYRDCFFDFLDHFFGAGFRPARFLYFQFRWTVAGRGWLAWE